MLLYISTTYTCKRQKRRIHTGEKHLQPHSKGSERVRLNSGPSRPLARGKYQLKVVMRGIRVSGEGSEDALVVRVGSDGRSRPRLQRGTGRPWGVRSSLRRGKGGACFVSLFFGGGACVCVMECPSFSKGLLQRQKFLNLSWLDFNLAFFPVLQLLKGIGSKSFAKCRGIIRARVTLTQDQ